MDFVSGVLSEMSSKFNMTPYSSDAVRRFLFKKEGVFLQLQFYGYSLFLHGYVSNASLVLDVEKMKEFAKDISESKKCSAPIHLEVKSVERGFSIFPRMRVGMIVYPEEKDWYRDDNEVQSRLKMTTEFIEGALESLTEVKRFVKKYQEYDLASLNICDLWKSVVSESDSKEKGKNLEKIAEFILKIDQNFEVMDIDRRTASEEIDIVISNLGRTGFYSQIGSPMILMECKNWSSKVDAKTIRDFVGKVRNRPKPFCSIGILLTASGITRDAKKELLRYSGQNFIIVTVEEKDIKLMISKKQSFSEMLEDRIKASLLR